MKGFTDHFAEKMQDQLLAPLERELNVRGADCAALFQGQFTLAVVPGGAPGDARTSPAVLLLLDTRDQHDRLAQTLAGLKKQWVDSGRTLRVEKIRGCDFTVLLAALNDVPKSVKDVFAPPRSYIHRRGETCRRPPSSFRRRAPKPPR